MVEENVLENMRRVFRYVQAYEKEFAKQQMKCYGEEKQKELSKGTFRKTQRTYQSREAYQGY